MESKVKLKGIITLVIILTITFIAMIVFMLVFYKISLNPVDGNDEKEVLFNVENGTSTNDIIKSLKENDLIKSELIFKIYTKYKGTNFQAGKYTFKKSMSSKEIYEMLKNGRITKDTVWITFIEGKRLTYYAQKIADTFNFNSDDVMKKLDSVDFVKSCIQKYDFITDDVLNKNIYHPLEGYLYPDTYEFEKDSSIEEIADKMLYNMATKLSKYESFISNNSYSIHEILTLASIVELEGKEGSDKKGIAGVFYNRISANWTLGSDVTTYYAVGKDFDKDLTMSELNSCNSYNTRGTCVKGLPAGPIASPGISSLEAALNPTMIDAMYFVSDKNQKTYFSKTDTEHQKIISELKQKGLWFTY